MGNQVAKTLSARSLQEQPARTEHRGWIGARAFSLLSHYYRPSDPIQLTAALGADWADVLEPLSREAIKHACIEYQRQEPKKKPTPAAVYAMAAEYDQRDASVKFWADWINSDKAHPMGGPSPAMRQKVYESGLVTAQRMRERFG